MKDEISWVRQKAGNKTFLITSNLARTEYYLYELVDNKRVKIASKRSPRDFDKLIK